MNVCVFGAGNMGARIAEVFLTNGHNVTMLDIKQEFIDRGVKTITNDLSFLVKKEKMTEDRKNELLAGLKTSVHRNRFRGSESCRQGDRLPFLQPGSDHEAGRGYPWHPDLGRDL